jgi:hypothetical protein
MEIQEQIAGAERLTAVLGYWPSFHDAEVYWIRLERDPLDDGLGPVLDALIKTEERTAEVSPDGHCVLRKHVSVLMRFHECDDVKLEDFNHQNALLELGIRDIRDRQLDRIRFAVHFVGANGVEATFVCRAIECVSVTPCDAYGDPTLGSADNQ